MEVTSYGAEQLIREAYEHMGVYGSPTEIMPIGLGAVDDLIGGIEPKEIVVIAARTGMGKSTLALSMAYTLERYNGVRVGWISLDDGPVTVGSRLQAFLTRVTERQLRTGGILREVADQATREAGETLRTRFSFMVGASGPEVVEEIYRMAHAGIRVLVLDYFSAIQKMTSNERGELNRFIISIREALASTGLRLILLCQIKRLHFDPKKQAYLEEPYMEDLAETSFLEQMAQVVILLWFDSEAQCSYLKVSKLKHLQVGLAVRKPVRICPETGMVEVGL